MILDIVEHRAVTCTLRRVSTGNWGVKRCIPIHIGIRHLDALDTNPLILHYGHIGDEIQLTRAINIPLCVVDMVPGSAHTRFALGDVCIECVVTGIQRGCVRILSGWAL